MSFCLEDFNKCSYKSSFFSSDSSSYPFIKFVKTHHHQFASFNYLHILFPLLSNYWTYLDFSYQFERKNLSRFVVVFFKEKSYLTKEFLFSTSFVLTKLLSFFVRYFNYFVLYRVVLITCSSKTLSKYISFLFYLFVNFFSNFNLFTKYRYFV